MKSAAPWLILFSLLAVQSARAQQDALKTIERTRGGRHWVDAKMDPPKSPEQAIKALRIAPGIKLELVAAEPLVFDPVAIAFDDRGRMFVVEYRDYPIGPPEGEPPLSRVVLLEDTNGDGKADRRTVFADRLNFAHSLMPYNGGILVGAQTEIIFLKDTDGDNQADLRQVLFKGFTPAHPQMQIGNPRWGHDNWIYLNYGPGKITSHKAPDEVVDMPRLDFRFHPLTHEFGADSGLGQFGNTVDNWGRRFFCTNRNPIMMSLLPRSAVQRNPFAIISKAFTDIAPAGGDTRVYPLVAMKSNYLSHAGTHTSACGVTAYLGDLLGGDYQNSVLVCEPVGHLVTRSIVKPDGVAPVAKRARPKADFIAATDTWFRPASLATGPDGALYLADMYRLHVEHPKFMPEDVAKKIDWRAGEDRGRIYRIVPEAAQPRAYHPPQSTSDLVALLRDTNGWRRKLAQRLLVERQAKDAAPALAKLLAGGKNELSRLHALWTLDGIGALTPAHVATALDDSSPYVRKDVVALSVSFFETHPAILEKVASLAGDNDIRVRYQVALALGDADAPRAAGILAKLALRDGANRWFALAILTSAKERSGAILDVLLTDQSFADRGDAAHIDLVQQLAGVVGARGDASELAALLDAITMKVGGGDWRQTAVLSGLASGLPRHRGELGRSSLPKLVSNPPQGLETPVERVRKLLQQITAVAIDRQRSAADRVAAIELLAHQPFTESVEAFNELLATDQPVAVQLACINAMRASGNIGAAEIVLARWPELGPNVRGPALDLLLRRTETTRQMLDAMAAGKVNPAVVGLDQRVRLLRHGDKQVAAVATELFGGAVSANRREVAKQYESALTARASSAAGAKVFERVCAKCHRLDGNGHDVGPDISDVRNRARDALLYDILDPNRAVEPRYTDYSVVTDDGRIFNGLMVSETADAVVLRQAEGKQQVIARNQIEQMQASGKSLMPEGVEKEVSVQQMADLLEFLKARDVPVAAATE